MAWSDAAVPDDLSPAVGAALRGDEAGFSALYTATQPGLLRYLRTLVGDEAEDVASETWCQIARDLPGLRDPAGFRGWAATIARHRAMDHLRGKRRRPVSTVPVEKLLDLPAGQPDPSELAAASISTDAAIALISSLPRDQAEAVMLRVVVGLDVRTTAAVLGKRAGAVRVAAHRGLRRLASEIENRSGRSAATGVTRDEPGTPEWLR